MSLKNPSLGWEKLQDVFYRDRELCQLSVPSEAGFKFSVTTTLLAVESDNSIEICHYRGQCVAKIDLTSLPSEVVGYEFDKEDEGSLIIAMADRLRIYHNWRPVLFKDYFLPDAVDDTIWSFKNRVAVMLSSQDVYHFDGNSLVRICENNERFALLTKKHWHCNKDVLVLLDVKHVFHLYIESGILSEEASNEIWHSVVVSPQGLVCLYNAKTYDLKIYKNGDVRLMEINLDSHAKDIAWCGDDTIACLFNNEEIKLFGPDSCSITFWFPEEIITLNTEIDGLKVVTNDKIWLISRVGRHTTDVFLMGSTEPSSILLDSVNFLSTQAPRAVENLKIINLDQGVAGCLDAALDELVPYWQKKLLSAAVFGKSSLPRESQNSKRFVDTCDKLRVLNMLTEKGIILTARHLEYFGLDKLISRLMKTGDFYECILVCKFLKVRGKIPKIFAAWANAKIVSSSEIDDDEIFKAIAKLAQSITVKVPMAEVGLTAFNEGRPRMAKDLIIMERMPAMELSALLELDEHELALKEGNKLGIPEMTLSVLLKLREQLNTAQFTKIIMLTMRDDQLFTYYSRHDGTFLFDFYRQTDQLAELAYHLWSEGLKDGTSGEFLPQVKELYSRLTHDSLIRNDQGTLERQVQLLEFQKSLAQVQQINVVNATLDDTIRILIVNRLDKQLVVFLRKFKVPDQKYYHIKCKALAREQRFDDLYKFAQERKSPIGYMPFYKSLLQQKRKKEASVYVQMISGISYEKRFEMYLQCGSYFDAIQLASKEKDVPNLKRIYKQIPPNEAQLRTLVNETVNKL
ncbi:LANO_0E10022g1_1 [Lachancea nothofagi CBS 11611]|uniref:Probable vacuolar protein sorting-associated protein 16 homolog n=1 Tax=Lachancea nothofagi CBS 11611 TaxID=1266666 RepID=A0A1G4JWL5_9SACH|nr:LANO_0E10022g1_1 [Lachancea nothofagi CBS 11611]